MKRIVTGLFIVAMIAGCNAVLTEEQARSTCEAVNASQESINTAITLAEQDREKGRSADESRELFRGDCEGSCGDDAQCFSDCTTCANAVVQFVYSSEP